MMFMNLAASEKLQSSRNFILDPQWLIKPKNQTWKKTVSKNSKQTHLCQNMTSFEVQVSKKELCRHYSPGSEIMFMTLAGPQKLQSSRNFILDPPVAYQTKKPNMKKNKHYQQIVSKHIYVKTWHPFKLKYLRKNYAGIIHQGLKWCLWPWQVPKSCNPPGISF